MRSNAGFTLIELLVVMAVAAVLLSLVAPSFTESIARRRVEGVAIELQSDLQYAKTQAVSTNTSVQLVTTAGGYTVGTAATPALYKTVTVPPNSTLSAGVTVSFEPYRTFPAGASTIAVANAGTAAQVHVNVDAKGGVRMCSPGGKLVGYTAC